ncbi:hypothetical protein HYH03_016885 [Edaphochlamys debaryana]|uniref:RNA polymerase-associated protein LEO1 n=1 Tax=Edaphochlamys debaryana TaxID=47281 RepID=A0A835XK81_9CHLO|nr:hypothetical protein HYH03_016885 [Edaphochlamys debaryana]|eukprot:KAG2484343.1 hypothetical protein HYH03_016885 [Edaphochlamys debaryana]
MADEEDNQIEDLFGSDDDDDDDFGKGRLRSNKSADDEPGPAPEEDLEDDLGDVVTKGTQGTGAYGGGSDYEDQGDQRSRRRLPAGGRRPLARTGAPIDYAAPLLSVPPPDGETHLLREGLIGIEPTPFDPATFAGEEEIIIDEKGLMKVKPADRTKIRWRYARQKGPDGSEQLVPESNARFVRWSDGSLQLMLGDEVFDVVTADISAQRAYMVAYSGVVQGQAALTSKMGFRLATLNSKLYARMREEVDKRTVKVKRVQQHVEALDPAKEKERRAKEAEELLRNRAQLEARQQRTMARYPGGGGGRSRGRPELNTRFLEEEDGIEVGGDEGFIDDAEEEPGYRRRRLNEDEEEEAARRLQSAKRAPPAAAAGGKRRRMQEESEAEEDDDEEEEEEYVDSEGDSEDEEGGDEEGGDDEEEEDEPAGRAKTPPKQLRAVPPLRGKVIPHMRPPERPAAPAAKVRRGVVLSDDEED